MASLTAAAIAGSSASRSCSLRTSRGTSSNPVSRRTGSARCSGSAITRFDRPPPIPTEAPLDARRGPLGCPRVADQRSRPEGIAGSPHAGPVPVGAYAAKLRDELRKRARVQVFREVFGMRTRRARVWFELRDSEGAVPCAMWRDAFDALRLPPGALTDGAQVVVAGGPGYYP